MRTIERTVRFRRDYKRELKGQHRRTLERDLISVLVDLSNDRPLTEKHRKDAELAAERVRSFGAGDKPILGALDKLLATP